MNANPQDIALGLFVVLALIFAFALFIHLILALCQYKRAGALFSCLVCMIGSLAAAATFAANDPKSPFRMSSSSSHRTPHHGG